MQAVITKFEQAYLKPQIGNIKSGDTVKVHQVITEGSKKRTQMFEGLVIRTRNMNSITATIVVRRIASGIGVEKAFLLHSSTITKVDVMRRSKVRRNYLSYMRGRGGKSARLSELSVDKSAMSMDEVKEKPPEASSQDDKESPKAVNEVNQETSSKVKEQGNKASGSKEAADTGAVKESKESDKASDKKAKAEAFRKAQESKK
jgi:large subunit ribosomal protein L19